MFRVCLGMLHSHKVVSEKKDMFCALCKKKTKKKLSFYTGHKNCWFYVKL
jgi:hypothetical protein